MKKFDRVLILGIDGMDPRITDRLLERGSLPNFKRLVSQGTYRRLPTSNPAQTPVAWTTIATGVNPGRHGIFDFIVRDPATYRLKLSLFDLTQEVSEQYPPDFLSTRNSPSFWEVAFRKGISTTTLRWPVTFPPSPHAGRLLPGFGVPDLKTNLGRYTWYTTEKIPQKGWQGDVVVLPDADHSETGLTIFSNLTVPFTLNRKQDEVEITVGRQRLRLRPNRWSDWVLFEAQDGRLRVAGQCKFFLRSVRPQLQLYATALELSPTTPLFPYSQPDSYADELAQAIGLYHTLGMPEDLHGFRDGCLTKKAFLDLCDEVHQERVRMLFFELGRFKKGLLSIVFDTLDRIQHVFWGKDERLIQSEYVRMDNLVGHVNKLLGPDTLLLILSDHGFTRFDRAVHLNSWLRDQGYQFLTENASAGRPLFQDVDWERTRAYAVGFSSIYINLVGREGRGIVDPSEATKLVQEIAAKLISTEDPVEKRRVFNATYATKDIYDGPQMSYSPDLVVGTNQGYRLSWQTALGAMPPTIVEDNREDWPGDHLVDPSYVPGVLFSNSPLNRAYASQLDIAPTVLHAFGLYDTGEWEGTSLFSRG